jgi:hypothetical protein
MFDHVPAEMLEDKFPILDAEVQEQRPFVFAVLERMGVVRDVVIVAMCKFSLSWPSPLPNSGAGYYG